jgi:hypothetical protein
MGSACVNQASRVLAHKLNRPSGRVIRQAKNGDVSLQQALAASRIVFAQVRLDLDEFKVSSAGKAFSNLQSSRAFLAINEYFRHIQESRAYKVPAIAPQMIEDQANSSTFFG